MHDDSLHSALRTRHEGQSLVLVALILTFLFPFVLTGLELAERQMERAALEDALRQSARAAVQTFRYPSFAADSYALQSEQERVKAVGRSVFVINAATIRGTLDTPTQMGEQIAWTVIPTGGGSCLGQTFRAPAVCATLAPRMRGLLSWGEWRPQLQVAVMLDRVE